MPKPETETVHRASCHCQSIIVEFKTNERLESKEHVVCNCSICTKNGYINYYVPKSRLHFFRGETILKEYSFEPHNRKHKFCGTCGTSILIYSNEKIPDNGKVGVNLRAVEGLDLQTLQVRPVDGRDRDPMNEMKRWQEERKRSGTPG